MKNTRIQLQIPVLLAVLFCAGWPIASSAQVTIDVTKITCEQFTLFKVADPNDIAIWLAGFYSGKRDKLVIDAQGLKENARKLTRYCVLNPKTLLLEAIEPSLTAQ